MPSLAKNKSKSLKPKKVALKNGHKNGTKNGIRVSAKTAVLKKAAKVIGKVMGKATGKATGKAGKRTYFFGGGKADGNEGDEEPARRQGRQPGRDGEHRPARAGRVHHHHRGLHLLLRTTARSCPKALDAEVRAAIAKIEKVVGAKFGDPKNPLLVSCRSGARASMPGMMDTVLNIGLNDKTVEGLVEEVRQRALRLGQLPPLRAMYGDVVLGMKPENKEITIRSRSSWTNKKQARGVKVDTELPADALKELVAEFKAAIKAKTGNDFPDDPLRAALGRDRGRVRVVEERPRHRLPPAERHPARVGHGRQRPGDGVRQHGRRLRAPASASRATRPPARTSSTAST